MFAFLGSISTNRSPVLPLCCCASLVRPASYISLILSTCRSQLSTMPFIRPWASVYSSKVLFSACVLHPRSYDLVEFSCRFLLPLYLVESNPISCPTAPLLNNDSETTQRGRKCTNCTPSCPKLYLRHHNQRKGRICKFDKPRCVVSSGPLNHHCCGIDTFGL